MSRQISAETASPPASPELDAGVLLTREELEELYTHWSLCYAIMTAVADEYGQTPQTPHTTSLAHALIDASGRLNNVLTPLYLENV